MGKASVEDLHFTKDTPLFRQGLTEKELRIIDEIEHRAVDAKMGEEITWKMFYYPGPPRKRVIKEVRTTYKTRCETTVE